MFTECFLYIQISVLRFLRLHPWQNTSKLCIILLKAPFWQINSQHILGRREASPWNVGNNIQNTFYAPHSLQTFKHMGQSKQEQFCRSVICFICVLSNDTACKYDYTGLIKKVCLKPNVYHRVFQGNICVPTCLCVWQRERLKLS